MDHEHEMETLERENISLTFSVEKLTEQVVQLEQPNVQHIENEVESFVIRAVEEKEVAQKEEAVQEDVTVQEDDLGDFFDASEHEPEFV